MHLLFETPAGYSLFKVSRSVVIFIHLHTYAGGIDGNYISDVWFVMVNVCICLGWTLLSIFLFGMNYLRLRIPLHKF